MSISIIIPTLNEEQNIVSLLTHLKNDPSFPLIKEIVVVDGRSEDKTSQVAKEAGAKVVNTQHRHRAIQMNIGAAMAEGILLYFLHADTRPPVGFAQAIWEAHQQGFNYGCFRLQFDWPHWFLNFSSWFTRFNWDVLRFGDQSLYIERDIFIRSNGFQNHMVMFEDQDIIKRIPKKYRFRVLPTAVVTSARKYRANGPYRLQLAYFLIYAGYRLGLSQQRLLRWYLSLVPYPRV